MAEKPNAKMIGEDGNIYNLIAIATRALRNVGQHDNAAEMQGRIYKSKSYDKALCIIQDYVNIY